MSRPISWPAEPYNGYMGSAKPAFGAKSEKNHSPLKFRRWNKAENNAEIRQKTLILSWACERIRMPLMLLKATCISPVAHSIAGGCHGASWHFSHTSFTGSPFSMTVLTLAVLTHCRADMQLPWHLPRGLIHTLRYCIIPRARERSLLLQDDEISCHRELLDSPASPRKGKRRGKKMFHTASGFIWGWQDRWTRLSSTHIQFFSYVSCSWV